MVLMRYRLGRRVPTPIRGLVFLTFATAACSGDGGAPLADDPILGSWSSEDGEAVRAYEFREDGTLFHTDERGTVDGTWERLDDGTLLIDLSGEDSFETLEYSVAIEGQEAVFTASGSGEAERYRRTDGG